MLRFYQTQEWARSIPGEEQVEVNFAFERSVVK